MATTEGLVPITRAYLARYYDKYPLPRLPDAAVDLAARLRALSADLAAAVPATPDEELLEREAAGIPAHKIDENMWKNREQIEEILFLLNKSHRPVALQQKSTVDDSEIASILDDIETKLKDMLKKLEQFQLKNADNVFNTVMTYMPQDFRGTLIRQQRERSERNKQAEVDALINGGGSIRDRYALLWKQQMERRVQLAQLGSATGVYKTLVRYLVGVPQVLMDFIRQINDDNGPMEEQRERYGPALYTLTKLVLGIRLYLHASLARYGQQKIEKDDIAVLQQAVVIYTEEFEKFLKFIGEVFVNAPFFISAEDAGAADPRKSDEYKEAIIPAGKTHEVIFSVDAVNSYIAWDFSLQQGALSMVQDIGFHVEYISPSGEKTLILPYRRYEADQGQLCFGMKPHCDQAIVFQDIVGMCIWLLNTLRFEIGCDSLFFTLERYNARERFLQTLFISVHKGNFCTVSTGSYKLVWDNSYSSFFKKSLRYKVDAVPPVIEPAVPTVEP